MKLVVALLAKYLTIFDQLVAESLVSFVVHIKPNSFLSAALADTAL
jgi:hypothetical protein